MKEGPFHKHSLELGASGVGSVTVDRCKSLNGRKEKNRYVVLSISLKLFWNTEQTCTRNFFKL